MSSTSDLDMSEASNSPASYITLESPHSSPPQQVPQLSSMLSGASCNDKNLYKNDIPFLKIIEQPQKHFRFRYDTEKSGSTHGSLVGKSYADKKSKIKTHPSVELVNYSGKAMIRCSIKYENDKNIHKDIYRILEDEQNIKNCTVPKKNSYKVGFPGIGIHTIKKKDLSTLLTNRLLVLPRNSSVDITKLRADCDNLAKSIDQNIVRLKFSAHDVSTGKEICDPVLSDPILNKKSSATNALKICRMSMYSGRPSGGEDLFLLVDRIDKNDIKVRFYEVDGNGEKVWSQWAVFLPSDVHYQCAIVCRTPPYIDPETSVNVKIWIELVRTSNGSSSEPKEFIYKADPVHKQYKKRKIAIPRSVDTSDSDITVASSCFDQPVVVLRNDPSESSVESETSQLALQPTSESEWNIISSTLEVLENENASGPILEQASPGPMWSPSQLTGQPLGSIAAAQAQPYPAELGIAVPVGQSCQAEFGIATPQALSCPAEYGIATPQALLCPADLGIATPQALPCPADLGIATPQALPCTADLGIATPPAQPIATVSVDAAIDDIFPVYDADDLTEYADVFGMSLEDFFQSGLENNNFVGDSGRVKEEPSTSPPQVGSSAGADIDAGSDDDVPRFQGGKDSFVTRTSEDADGTNAGARELLLATETSKASNDVTDLDSTEFFPATIEDAVTIQGAEAIDSKGVKASITVLATEASNVAGVEANAVAGACKSVNEGASKSTDTKMDADYPASFTPEDAEEVKKLVLELCEIIRDKKCFKSEVATKLERLFDIRLSNGDTFLRMTLFKNQRSFEALIKMVDTVKMSHLLNYSNHRGETILHLAVIHGTPELVTLLVAKGCDPAARTCEDESTLHYAVRYGGVATLRALLDAAGAALDLDALNAERQSALHLCALHGRERCAALLGARGASGAVRDAAGRTPLHLCAYDARVSVARALLPHVVAHVDALDGGGRTPLAVACARAPSPPALELARALLAAGARAELAWSAARDLPAARELLRAHAPPGALLDEVKPEPHDEDEDDEYESGDAYDPEDDEYESADDKYALDDDTPESLTWKLRQMGLTNSQSPKSQIN